MGKISLGIENSKFEPREVCPCVQVEYADAEANTIIEPKF